MLSLFYESKCAFHTYVWNVHSAQILTPTQHSNPFTRVHWRFAYSERPTNEFLFGKHQSPAAAAAAIPPIIPANMLKY